MQSFVILALALQPGGALQTLMDIMAIVAVVGGFAMLRRYVKRLCNNKLNKTK